MSPEAEQSGNTQSDPEAAGQRVIGVTTSVESFPSKARQDFDETRSGQDIKFREWYGWGVPIAVAIVLITSNVIMFLIGHAYDWVVPPALAAAFFASVFAEVVGLMALIVRSIFPSGEND